MIALSIPFVPPSINQVYFTKVTKVGNHLVPKRILTAEGKKFKREVSGYLVQNFPTEMKFFRRNAPYAVLYQVFFDEIENTTYPKKTDVRYKTLDATNRVKIVEDALVEATGVDDSQTLFSTVIKSKGKACTYILAWDLENEPIRLEGTLIDGALVCLPKQD